MLLILTDCSRQGEKLRFQFIVKGALTEALHGMTSGCSASDGGVTCARPAVSDSSPAIFTRSLYASNAASCGTGITNVDDEYNVVIQIMI